MRTCRKCGEAKPLEAFPKGKRYTEERQWRCKTCRSEYMKTYNKKWREANPKYKKEWRAKNQHKERAYYLMAHYGLSLDEYESMREAQNRRCAICQTHEDDCPRPNNARESLMVDHCHESGKIRGLLCTPCNLALGYLRDSPDLMRTAIDYVLARG